MAAPAVGAAPVVGGLVELPMLVWIITLTILMRYQLFAVPGRGCLKASNL